MIEIKESISSLMDNEFANNDGDILKNIFKNKELLSTWYRYYYIRDLLQNEVKNNNRIEWLKDQKIINLLQKNLMGQD